MFTTVIYFLPCIISILWFALYLFRKKNNSQWILLWLLGFAAIHYMSTAIFVAPTTDFKTVCSWDIVCQPLVLVTIALCVIYIRSHLGKTMSLAKMQIFLIPAIIQGVVIWLLYFLIGFDNVVRFTQDVAKASSEIQGNGDLFNDLSPEFDTQLYRLFFLFDERISNIWSGILAICLVFSCAEVSKKYGYKFGDAFRYWFMGGESTSERGVSFWMLLIVLSEIPFLAFGRKYIYNHPALGMSMAILSALALFFMAFCEYYTSGKRFTLYSLIHAEINAKHADFVAIEPEQNMAKDEVAENKEEAIKEEVTLIKDEPVKEEVIEINEVEQKGLQNESTSPIISARMEEKNNSIASDLRHLLEEEKIFTDKDLTLEILAKRMNTNRNKLSTIVNQVYGMDFRNILAQLRIEEAKKYMRANPTATSETVAVHCGFKDTSAFFHRFKDIVGESPRMWIAK